MTNAVQHTGPGGLIAIGSAVVDEEARLWVRDDGPGIPLDEQEHIFERFGAVGTPGLPVARGPDWGWRSSARSLGPTAVASGSTAVPGRARASRSSFPSAPPDEPEPVPEDVSFDPTRELPQEVAS